MKIGAVAKQAGISVEAVRFYEKQGLINTPLRNDSGYRVYSADITNQLMFVTRAKELGFSLKEIKELLLLRNSPNITCAEIKHQAEKKIADIERKIKDLKLIRDSLVQLTNSCPGIGTIKKCPILGKIDNKSEVI
ncbi:MAG: heavy metal-responsive transcriptional regulator [Deltaproteobacteria bacterium]|nr:heavy metal-responsive transcriptional regulator [Deltaproteobacteria bacterium]